MSSTTTVAEGVVYTASWYHRKPRKDNLAAWISGSKGLIKIVANEEGMLYSVCMASDPTFTGAMTSAGGKRVIYVGRIYVNKAEIGKTEQPINDWPTVSLMASNGTVIHESGHVRYGSTEGLPLLAGLTTTTRLPLLKQIFNIVEDVYIEEMLRREFPVFTPFVAGKNAFLFNDRDLAFMVKNVNSTFQDPQSLLQVLTLTKRFYDFSHIELFNFDDEHYQNAYSAAYTALSKVFSMGPSTSVKARIDVAKDILTIILNAFDENDVRSASSAAASGDPAAHSMPNASGTTTSTEKIKGEGETASVETSSARKYIDSIESALTALTAADEVDLDGPVPTIVMTPPMADEEFPMDERFTEIGKHFQQVTTQSTTFGPARTRGRIVPQRLYRIATDSKVCGNREEITKYKKNFEVTILVDFSGSMGHLSSHSKSRITRALKVAIGMKYSLDLVGIRCNVYCHTGDYSVLGCNNLVMIKLAPQETKTSYRDVAKRVWTLMTDDDTYPLYQNRDGNAITWITNNGFSRGNAQKILIAISDGEPLADGYSGHPARAHTKDAVRAARTAGIKVFSISITTEADEANTWIYGGNSNIYSEDPEAAIDIVEKLMANKE